MFGEYTSPEICGCNLVCNLVILVYIQFLVYTPMYAQNYTCQKKCMVLQKKMHRYCERHRLSKKYIQYAKNMCLCIEHVLCTAATPVSIRVYTKWQMPDISHGLRKQDPVSKKQNYKCQIFQVVSGFLLGGTKVHPMRQIYIYIYMRIEHVFMCVRNFFGGATHSWPNSGPQTCCTSSFAGTETPPI